MTTESIQERHTTSLSSLHVHIHHSHTSGCSHICEHTYKCLSILYSQTHVKMLIQLTSARMLNSKLEFNSLLKFTNLLKWGNNTWEKIASKEFNNWITDWWWPLNCWNFEIYKYCILYQFYQVMTTVFTLSRGCWHKSYDLAGSAFMILLGHNSL